MNDRIEKTDTDLSEQPVLVVAGPTASGKTETAIRLAEALDGEIISADSMQIYRGMDIGTAKATRAEQQRVPHHIIDILNPGEPFSVAEYQTLALDKIRQIKSRGHQPILCGGTGQYLAALTDGIEFSPVTVDPELRRALNAEAEQLGLSALWQELQSCDPETAAKISGTDRKRIIRALEVYRQTGKTISWYNAKSKQKGPAYPYLGFCLSHERSELYRRIDRRVVKMIESGLIEETRALLALNLPAGSTCLQAIGYKELIGYLQGKMPLDEAQANIQQATRRYAKRQLTWFRKMTELSWLNDLEPAAAAEIVLNHIQNKAKLRL